MLPKHRELIDERVEYYKRNPFELPKLYKKFTIELVADFAGYMTNFFIKSCRNFGLSQSDVKLYLSRLVSEEYDTIAESNQDNDVLKERIYSWMNIFKLGIDLGDCPDGPPLVKMSCTKSIAICQNWLDRNG